MIESSKFFTVTEIMLILTKYNRDVNQLPSCMHKFRSNMVLWKNTLSPAIWNTMQSSDPEFLCMCEWKITGATNHLLSYMDLKYSTGMHLLDSAVV